MWIVLLMLALSAGISWFNCRSVGRVWNESKALGGWIRLLAWCGAIQAAIGFSSVIGFFIGAALFGAGWLPAKVAQAAASLWYLLIIIPALSSGLIILIESWISVWRERSLASMSITAFNTFALLHNSYSAIDGITRALASMDKLFFDADEEANSLLLAATGLVVVALGSGVVVTMMLIRHYAGTIPLPDGSAHYAMQRQPG